MSPATDYSRDFRPSVAPALEHPRPLEHLELSLRAMGLGGDLALAKTIYLAATTRVLGRKGRLHAHTFVLGPASSGKSFEMDAALQHLPPEAIVRYDGCSPRALIYDERDIQHKVLVYSEMDALPLGNGEDDALNTALSYLRTLVVNGVASYDVVVRAKEGFSTKRYTREGPATLLVTGTKRIKDEQLASRLHEIEMTVDRARLESVFAAQGRLLRGAKARGPAEAIIEMQAYLQSLAPLDVTIPFADHLGNAILAAAKLTDPRLTREFPRVAGFTAAHALLCIERRARGEDGSVVATLEDYEAARGVIRELSTVREFSRFAIEVWEVVNTLFKETNKPVTVQMVSKLLFKAHDHVRRTFNALLVGGALQDARERPSRTSPHLVVPTGTSPVRILLPAAADLVITPPEERSKRGQPEAAQSANFDIEGRRFDIEAPHFDIEASSMKDKDLTPLRHSDAGGISHDDSAEEVVIPVTPSYRYQGQDYAVGDRLPDGREVLAIDGGIPTLSKRSAVGTAQ